MRPLRPARSFGPGGKRSSKPKRMRSELKIEFALSLLALRARLFAEQHKLFLADEDGRGKLSGDLLAILQRPGHHRAPDPALFLGEERVRLQVGGLGDVVKAAASLG